MRSTLRTLYFGLFALCGLTAVAQNPITIMGTVAPWNGAAYPIWFLSDPGTIPMVDTVIYSSGDPFSNYSFTFDPISPQGVITVKLSCDGEATWDVVDWVSYYSATPGLLMVNIECGVVACRSPLLVNLVHDTVVCSSALIPLSLTAVGPGPFTYHWDGPGTFYPNNTSASVSVQSDGGIYFGTVSNACGSISDGVVVTVQHAPDVGISVDTSLCDATGPVELFPLLGGTPVPYGLWSHNGAPHANIYDPSVDGPGTYVYVITTPCWQPTSTVTITELNTWYADTDDDGLGDPDITIQSCAQPAGYVSNAYDECPSVAGTTGSTCDDGDPSTTNDQLNANCECVGVDPTTIMDCLGVYGGTDLPSTACADLLGNPGEWSTACICMVPCIAPTITNLMNDTVVCPGAMTPLSVTAIGTSPFNYHWYGPGTFYPNNTSASVAVQSYSGGVYTVTVSNACGSASQNALVMVDFSGDVGLDTDTSLCDATGPVDLFSLVGGTPDPGGIWKYNDAPHSNIYDPSVDGPGIYRYFLTTPCLMDSATVTITELNTWYADADDDGLGDPNITAQSCTQPVGYVGNSLDGCPTVIGTIGSACDDGDPSTVNDHLNANCECVGMDPTVADCLGIFGGTDLPGTACTDIFGQAATWNSGCVCDAYIECQPCFTTTQVAPFTAVFADCSTGSLPFQYLWDFGDGGDLEQTNPVTHVFSAPGDYSVCMSITDAGGELTTLCKNILVGPDGTINPPAQDPCEADFLVIQAYDSTGGGNTPVPNEVWVLDLSTAIDGIDAYAWDFGDGSTSTETYPTHLYDGPGPYELCLTISNGSCSDLFCDTVSMDEAGLLNGMMIDGSGHPIGSDGGVRSNGFTLNVLHDLTTALAELPVLADLQVWPNPVQDELNITLHSGYASNVTLTVMDLSGRTVLNAGRTLALGSNQIRLDTTPLEEGLYLLRFGDGAQSVTQRFLKMR